MSYSYPILKKITKLLTNYKGQDLKNIKIFFCQHLLEPQVKMFNLLVEFGILKENIYILGKIYSANLDIVKELQSDNFNIILPNFNFKKDFDIQHKKNCLNMYSKYTKNLPKDIKIIIIDDGGELINVFNEKFKTNNKFKIIGIEQTSSGFRKLENKIINFPIINVARSYTKLKKETPFIIKHALPRIKQVFKDYSIKDSKILIVGLGPIGRELLITLKREKYVAIGHDLNSSNKKIIEIIKENNINIIIAATGNVIMNKEDLKIIEKEYKKDLYLISISSSDREFPSDFLRKNKNSEGCIHSDSIWKNIILINNGFPISFKGNRIELPEKQIEKTIALLYGSALYVIINNIQEKSFIKVPKIIEKEL